MTPAWHLLLTVAIGVAAVVTSGCAEDDIVVYREHGEQHTDGEGGARLVETGGRATGSGGLHNAGGAVRGAGGRGSGGREPLSDAGLPSSGGGGTPVTSGSGGTGAASGAAGLAGMNGGGTAGLGGQCATTDRCPPSFYCEKPDCTAPFGVCLPRPTLCPDQTPLPVCGCDGVTYWHDCLRKQNGVSANTLTECTFNAHTCTTSADCGIMGASCAHVTPIPTQACGAPSPGICWVTPLDCSQTPPAPTWVPCQGLPGGPSGRPGCVSTCEAIRSGMEYVASMGPCR